MAQVTISEEHYRELAALAQARSTTPDVLADELLDTLLTATDQIAFWGPILIPARGGAARYGATASPLSDQ